MPKRSRGLAVLIMAAAAIPGCGTSRPPQPKAEVPGHPQKIHWEQLREESIIGHFGLPLGRHITIEGRKYVSGPGMPELKWPSNSLFVDTVEGKELERPQAIVVKNIADDLPRTGRMVLRGYEFGYWIGVPEDVLQKTGRHRPSAGRQFVVVFQTLEVVRPPSLKTGMRPLKGELSDTEVRAAIQGLPAAEKADLGRRYDACVEAIRASEPDPHRRWELEIVRSQLVEQIQLLSERSEWPAHSVGGE